MQMMPLFAMFLFTFFLMEQPLALAALLILSAAMSGVFMSFFLQANWMAYLLFMVFLSAMMVVILYMSSVASNAPLNTKISLKQTIVPIMATGLTAVALAYLPMNYAPFTCKKANTLTPQTNMLVNKTYAESFSYMSTFLLAYLLMVLIVVMFLIASARGPLRTKK